MGSRIREVLRSYTTRWEWWLMAAAWLVLILANVAAPSIRLVVVVMVFPYANVMLGMVLGILLKFQFADARARLLPGFAAAHLAAAAGIVTTAVALESGAIGLGGSVSGWGVAGLALVLIAAAAWCTYLFSMLSFLLIAGLPALAMAIAPQRVIGPMQAAILGNNLAVAWGAVGVGAAALAVLGVRLWRLSEEMPEYSRRIPATVWDLTSRAARRDRLQWEAQLIARSRLQGWLTDIQFRLVLPRAAGRSVRARLLLRQLAGGAFLVVAGPTQLVFMLCPLGLLLVQKGLGRVDGALGTLEADAIEPILLWSMIMPILFAMGILTGALIERWPFAARELLHPLSRTDFVSDVIRSSACDTLGFALGHGAGIVVGLALLVTPGSLMGLLLPCLVIMALQYVLLFGAMLWLVSFRRYWMAALGIMAASVVSGIVAAALLAGHRLMPWTLAVAAPVTVAAAVGLYRLAFRRWCEVDLG